MKRLFIEVGLVAAAACCAVLAWSSPRTVSGWDGSAKKAEKPEEKANTANKVLAGEIVIDAEAARRPPSAPT
jgi:hypothetical protein